MNNEPTIKDVARLAGVSIGTVDRVLHNRGKVSTANQAAVKSAIESLNYHPSQVARALSIRRHNLKIGVSIPFVEHDFWTDACQGVTYATAQMQKFGVEVILDIYNSYDVEEQRGSLERLLARNISGIVMTPVRSSQDLLESLIPTDMPYCTAIDDCPMSRRLFHIGPDDYSMGRAIAKFVELYQPDHLQAAVIAPNIHLEGTNLRINGFRDKFREDRREDQLLEIFEIDAQTEKLSYENIYEKTLELIRNYPDLNAVYVTNGLTQWAAAAVIAAGKRETIQVFGHEYTNMTREFVQSGPITAAIYQKPANQLNTAIRLLYEHMVGERQITEANISTECSVITKETLPLIQVGALS